MASRSGGASDSRMAGVDVRYASKDGALSGSVELANSSKIVDGGSVSGPVDGYAQGQYRGQGVSGQLYAKKVTPWLRHSDSSRRGRRSREGWG